MEIFNYVKSNNLFELKKYLQFGNVNIVDENGKSLLHHCVEYKAIDCINLLIENYIDLNIKDNKNQTAIFDAAIKGHLGIIKLLIKSGSNVNVQDQYGNIPLFYAIKSNNMAIVDLLSSCSDLTISNNNGENILFKAIKYKYHNIDKFISNIDTTNNNNDTVLHYAAKYNNIDLLKKFVDRYKINLKNNYNETLFYYAAKYSNRDIIIYLLKFLPCIEIKNKYSETLLEVAKTNPYDIYDLIENYISSLDYINYKSNSKIIYDYLCTNEVDLNKGNINKKDKFALSLIDYLNFNNDKINLKKVTK